MSSDVLTAIEERVKTVADIQDVQGAVDFSAITNKSIPLSIMAFVLPLGTDPSEQLNQGIHAPVLQHERLTFGVVIAIRNTADAYGNTGNKQLNAIREGINAVLLGHKPAPDYDPIALAKGRLMPMKDYTVFWQQAYYTSTLQQG